MRHEFSMRCFTEIGVQLVETHEIECAVEIEPDEMMLGTSWYVSGVQVHGYTASGKARWFHLHERTPLFQQIKAYALAYESEPLEALWDEYCDEHPGYRMPTDREEHGTYRAGAL